MSSGDAATPAEQRLSIREKVCYGLGDVGNALAVSSISFWLLIYLTDVAGLGAFLAGVAMMIGRTWDALADPIVGWFTDHTHSRWGKRRPFLLFGALPYAVCFAALWFVPSFSSEVSIFIYVTIALLCFNTCFASVIVPYASLTASITNDYHERLSLTGYRMVASQSSFLVGAALPSALVLWITSPSGGEAFFASLGLGALVNDLFGSWSHTARQGYGLMGVVFGVVIVASVWTVFFGIRERIVDVRARDEHSKNPFGYGLAILKQLKSNPPFRMAVGILCLSECAAALIAVNLPYFLTYVLDLEAGRSKVLTALFLGAIVAIPMWTLFGKRFGKSETYRVVVLIYAVVLCFLPFLPRGEMFPTLCVAVAGGICHSAALMIPWSMIPDVVEYDELHNQTRREGLFYGGALFAYKLATAAGVMISGSVLALIGYVPNEIQSSGTVLGMKLFICLGPALFLVFGSRLAGKYPLSASKHRAIIAELKRQRPS